jgi:hypothetical protein
MAHGAVSVKLFAVIGDNSGGFLAAMLKGVEPERSQRSGVGMSENPENTAFFMRMVVIEGLCCQHELRTESRDRVIRILAF